MNQSHSFGTHRACICALSLLGLGAEVFAQDTWNRPDCNDPVIELAGTNLSFFKDFKSAIASGDLAKRGSRWEVASSQGNPTGQPATTLNGWPTEPATSRIFSSGYQRPKKVESGGNLRLKLSYDMGSPVVGIMGQTLTSIGLIGDSIQEDGTSTNGTERIKYYLLDEDALTQLDEGELGIWVQTVNTADTNTGNLDMQIKLWVDLNHEAAFDQDPEEVFFDQYITRLQELSPGFIRTGPNWSNNNIASPLSPIVSAGWYPDWTLRTLPTSPRWSVNEGVPWEVHAWLANKLNVDLWVCVPFIQFDPNNSSGDPLRDTAKEYVQGMADVLKAELNSNLHVYVEYSNEAWNGSFTTKKWLVDQRGAGDVPAQRLLFAQQAADVFDWFLDAWYPDQPGQDPNTQTDCRVQLVAMGSTADVEWAKALIDELEPLNLVDAIGCAVYFGPDPDLVNKWLSDDMNVYNGDIPNSVMKADLEQRIEDLSVAVNLHALETTNSNGRDLDLILYEGGPSLVSLGVFDELGDDYSDFQDSLDCAELVDDIMDIFLLGDNTNIPLATIPSKLAKQFGYFAFCQQKDDLFGDFLLLTDLWAGTVGADIDPSTQEKFDIVKSFNITN